MKLQRETAVGQTSVHTFQSFALPLCSALLINLLVCATPTFASGFHSQKKGAGAALKNDQVHNPVRQANAVHNLNASWYYDWGIPDSRNLLVEPDIEFVPMKWGKYNFASKDFASIIAGLNVPGYHPVENFLGFNEPDHVPQANMTVAELLSYWPLLEDIANPNGLNIGSAAMTGNHQMQQDFMAQAGNLKVDFMTFHEYPGMASGVDAIMNSFQSFYTDYGREIWLTEFNVADWAGDKGYTHEESYSWMVEMLYRMEESPIVTRYAVFSWDTSWPAGYASAIFEETPNGGESLTLTPLGKLYSDYRTDDIHGPYSSNWYYLHNKASHQHLSDGPALATVYEAGDVVHFSLMSAGNGNYYLINKNSGKRLGYNGTTLYMANSSATGSWVQWRVSDGPNGWDYVDHVGFYGRLSGYPLSVVDPSTTGDAVRWAFVRAHLPTEEWATSLLVGGATLNGDFNDPALDANFEQVGSWVQLGSGSSTLNATKYGGNSNNYDGTPFAMLGFLPGSKVFALDTAHTIGEDDVFSIEYVWKDGHLWEDASDQVRVSLFVTSDDTLSGTRTDLITDLSGISTTNDTYELVQRNSLYIAGAEAAGKRLFVAIDTTITNEGYAQMDNFGLSVVSRPLPNYTPAFVDGTLSLTDATAGIAYSGTIAPLAFDADGDPMTFSRAITGPSWLHIAEDGTLSGTPETGDIGLNQFFVQVHDGGAQVGRVSTAKLEIHVATPPNYPPAWLYGNTWTAAFTEDQFGNYYPEWRVSDPENDNLSWTKVSGPNWISVNPTSGEMYGTPSQADVGTQSLVIEVSDGVNPAISATVTLTIANVNDAPAFAVDPIIGANANASVAYTGSVANATDDDGDSLTYSKTGGPTWLTVATDGSLSGTPSAADEGANTFTVEVSDGNGGVDTATLNIEVGPVPNYPPAWLYGNTWSLAFTEDLFGNHYIEWRVSDPEGNSLSWTKVSGPNWITVNPTSGAIYGTPSQADVGTQSLIIEVSDGVNPAISATVTLTIANVNDAPAFAADPITAANANASVAYTGSVANATDDDGDSLAYSKTGGPTWLTVATDGSLSGTPSTADEGANTFTVEVSDGNGGVDTATLNIEVGPVPNYPPAWLYGNTWSLAFTEDQFRNHYIEWRVSDPEGDNLSWTKVSGPNWISVNPTSGEMYGTPSQADVGTQSLVIEVSDGVNPAISATVTLTIANVNDAPAFAVDPIIGANANASVAYTGSVANATDDDGDSLTYSKTGGPTWLTVATDGSLSGTPSTADEGANTFTVEVSDGNGGVDTATLNIEVGPVPNYPPAWRYGNTWSLAFTEDLFGNHYIEWRVSDPEGNSLSWTKVSGPNWISVNPTSGETYGTPSQADVGTQSLVIEVSDGVNPAISATVTLTIANSM